ncbi:MAG: FAD-dependent oxidoreductase [Eubacteriales bacterium]|nr:FAD-dependent oxidoreductase [Eubacteriales bacterium]
MKSAKYPNLFKPGKIGNVELKNRIVMPPTEILAAGFNGEMTDDLIRFYEERAKGGVGLIITCYASVDDEFSQSFAGTQLRVTDPRLIGGYTKFARTMHKYGTKVMTQIYQAGRQAVPTAITGKRIVAPSAVGYSLYEQIPEEMTLEEIKRSVKKWGCAAKLLQNSSYDGVELLAAGGYLINEFLSPYSNKRTDEYGGSFENRFRFLKEVVEEIREQCGKNFLLSVRITADEFLGDQGYGLEEGVRIAQELEKLGVDCINVNNANQENRYYIIEPITFKAGWKSYIIKAIKDAVSIPVIATNVIKRPEDAEKFLAEGIMDYAAIARGNMADENWAKKALEDRSNEIKPCIGCLHCLDETGFYRRSECAVNARMAREDEFKEPKVDMKGRQIVVVGAGPSGMEAAIVMRQRGAEVVVLEKNDFIGGAVELGSRTVDKDPMHWLADYYKVTANKLGIKVLLNTEATPELIASYEPYAVFVGAGVTPFVPVQSWLDNENVYTVEEVLRKNMSWENKKVTVIGGGMTGCEVAEKFAMAGNEVTLVEMRDKLAPEVHTDNLFTVLNNLKKSNAKILLQHRLLGIGAEGVSVENMINSEQITLEADVMILSLGGRPNRALYDQISDQFERVINIGDSVKPGRVYSAVHSGFESAWVLE